jgi:hypothetical protein
MRVLFVDFLYILDVQSILLTPQGLKQYRKCGFKFAKRFVKKLGDTQNVYEYIVDTAALAQQSCQGAEISAA